MTTRKPTNPYSVVAGIERREDGVWIPTYKHRMTRFMFDGGAIADVLLIVDNGDLRNLLLSATGQDGIVGVAIIEEEIRDHREEATFDTEEAEWRP
jgi:hypothetical protein